MTEILFILALQLLGLAFGLLFRGSIPLPILCASAFLWGTLLWVGIALVLLCLSVPLMLPVAGMVLAACIAGLAIRCVRLGTLGADRSSGLAVGGTLLVSALLSGLVIRINPAIASFDSFSQIQLGREIAWTGLTPEAVAGLGSWGACLVLLQAASLPLGRDYLVATQPCLAVSLALTFLLLTAHGLESHLADWRKRVALSVVATAALFSSYLVVFQAFYIHNSLWVAAYLLFALAAFWLHLVGRGDGWVVLGSLAILGVGMGRMDTPPLAITVLALALSFTGLSYRRRLLVFLPPVLVLTGWYLLLFKHSWSGGDILTPGRALAVIGILAAFALLVLLSGVRRLQEVMREHMHRVVLAACAAALCLVAYRWPWKLAGNVATIAGNLLFAGRWGYTWHAVLVLLLFAPTQGRVKEERFFTTCFATFASLILVLGSMRVPYRLGWGDSANRIMTHILPAALLYLCLKYTAAVDEDPVAARGARRRAIMLVSLVLVGLVAAWLGRRAG